MNFGAGSTAIPMLGMALRPCASNPFRSEVDRRTPPIPNHPIMGERSRSAVD